MDLARLRGMSLSDASELLGKVYGGNTSILRRYGIRVRQGATATEALAEVQKMAADQAEAFADTSLGAWTALELKIEDVKEAVGKQLLPAMDSLAVGIDAALDPVGTASLLFGLLQSQMEGNTVAFEAVWRASKDLAPQLGLTAEGWRETIQTADDSNRSFTDFADSIKMRLVNFAAFRAEQEALGFVFDEVTARWSKAPEELARAVRPLPGIVAAARDDALHEAMQFGPSLRDTIKASKDEIREAMTDVRWAMEHPFAGDRLARYMEDKAQAMNRKLITALRQGKTDAAEETGDIVNAILSELSVLEGQNYSIGVAMRFREQQKRGSFGQGEANRRAGRRAHGGPVSAGQTFLVGENGPEFLHMGSQSGHVSPNDGGSMRPIVVNVDGHELFRIMDARGGSRYATAGRGSYYRTTEKRFTWPYRASGSSNPAGRTSSCTATAAPSSRSCVRTSTSCGARTPTRRTRPSARLWPRPRASAISCSSRRTARSTPVCCAPGSWSQGTLRLLPPTRKCRYSARPRQARVAAQ